MRTPKLKPCPYCGGKKMRRDKWATGFGVHVEVFFAEIRCRSCGATIRGEYRGFDEPLEDGCEKAMAIAVAKWNTRTEGEAK